MNDARLEIKCPHFISTPGHGIKCHGVVPDTGLRTVFSGATDDALENRAKYIGCFCADAYTRCPIYQAIEKGMEGAVNYCE